MELWQALFAAIGGLRQACSRTTSFLWLTTALAGICARSDLLGVSSIIRTLGLGARYYDRLLDFFHSPAVDPDRLASVWSRLVLRLFGDDVYYFNNRPVLLGDGIKVPKSGRKMPAVKLLHQESENNTKPQYIMGHSIQVVSLLVRAAGSFLAVPLMGRIHEGVVFSNRDHRTIPIKFGRMVDILDVGLCYLVADAYYACQQIVNWLLKNGGHLISRVRCTTVAHLLVTRPANHKARGRPQLYGEKIHLWDLFANEHAGWQEVESPVYGEKGISVRLLCLDLVWKPLRRVVRFVLVRHPTRGSMILMSTDISLLPIDILRLYGLRFKIEVSFKQALRTVGVYAYHFWMMAMKKISHREGDQYLHMKTDKYRHAVRRKVTAYHRHIQIGLIAQGLLMFLAVKQSQLVWKSFGSWLRTIRSGIAPSEFVVATALRNSLPNFLIDRNNTSSFTKFIRDRLDLNRTEGLRLAG